LEWNDQITFPEPLEFRELLGHIQDTLVPIQVGITEFKEFIGHIQRVVDQLGKTHSTAVRGALENGKSMKHTVGS